MDNWQDSDRRWPVVTIALVAISIALFAITHRTMAEQRPQIADVKVHILMMAAANPGLDISPDVRVFISNFSEHNSESWQRLQQANRPFADEWDEKTRSITNQDTLQQEMDGLVGQYEASENTAFSEKYAFAPSSPMPLAHVTASFLHATWKTLLGSMLVLLLAGTVLEDAWGRIIFVAFYFAACAVAMQIRAWTDPASLAPVMGASGAVAVLMGAVLVRFPAKKLRVGALGIPAFCLAPVWLAVEALVNWRGLNRDYARVFEQSALRPYATSVVAAFLFGAAAAIVFRYLRVERNQTEAPKRQAYASGAAAMQAEALMENGNYSSAESVLKDALKTNPGAVDALMGLQQVYYHRNEMLDYQATTISLCQTYVKARDSQAAWQAFEEYLNSGGQDMPPATWLELCRIAEELQLFDRAVLECEKIIAMRPNTRESLMAQLRAAKICLKQLGQPEHALKMFQAAYASPIPHLDFEQAIENGIRESKVAISMLGSFPVTD
jgi:membrane associated rhomboid family serine protease